MLYIVIIFTDLPDSCSLSLSIRPSLLSIAPGSSSKLHPVSARI